MGLVLTRTLRGYEKLVPPKPVVTRVTAYNAYGKDHTITAQFSVSDVSNIYKSGKIELLNSSRHVVKSATVTETTHTYTFTHVADGTYTVRYVVTDNRGILKDGESSRVVMHTPIKADASLSTSHHLRSITATVHPIDPDRVMTRYDLYIVDSGNKVVGGIATYNSTSRNNRSFTWNNLPIGKFKVKIIVHDNLSSATHTHYSGLMTTEYGRKPTVSGGNISISYSGTEVYAKLGTITISDPDGTFTGATYSWWGKGTSSRGSLHVGSNNTGLHHHYGSDNEGYHLRVTVHSLVGDVHYSKDANTHRVHHTSNRDRDRHRRDRENQARLDAARDRGRSIVIIHTVIYQDEIDSSIITEYVASSMSGKNTELPAIKVIDEDKEVN